MACRHNTARKVHAVRSLVLLPSLILLTSTEMLAPLAIAATVTRTIEQILNASGYHGIAAQAQPCRAGTYPVCYPAATASGYACMVKPGASATQIGSAISWACGAGGTDCAAISGAAGNVGPCWDKSKQPAEQDIVLFGNYVFEKYYAAHCFKNGPAPPGQPCPGPGSPGASACGFGGVAELAKAPVEPACHPGPAPPTPPPPAPPPPSPVPPVPPECHTWYDEADLHNSTTFRNVKAFGAVGDGTADDSIAINRALSHGRNMSAMLTTQPAVVYLPPGTYQVSTTLQMAFYTFIVGNPKCTPTIHWTGSNSAAIGGPASCDKCEHTNVSLLPCCRLLDVGRRSSLITGVIATHCWRRTFSTVSLACQSLRIPLQKLRMTV